MLSLLREEEGQGIVEYAILLGLVATAVILAMLFLRGNLQSTFSDIGKALRKPWEEGD